MIKVGQTTTNQTIALPYELNNDGDTSIQLNELKGNTTQNGTPTPTSPQQVNVVKGKNLAEIEKLFGNTTFYSINNDKEVTLIVADNRGWGNLDGVSWGQYLPSGTYTISFNPNNNGKLQVNEKGVGDIINNVSLSSGHATFTLTNGGIVGVKFTGLASYLPYNAGHIQIEQGSTATPYLPYNTIQAVVTGKNIFDNTTNNDIWVMSNGQIGTSTGANCIKTYCQANDKFSLSATFQSASSNGIICMAFYDNNGNLLNRYTRVNGTSLNMTYTAPTNTAYMWAGHYIVNPSTIQLEKGTATTYEPYKSNNYPLTLGDIELCKIGNYQDRIYKNNGKWYLEKNVDKFVLDKADTSSGKTYCNVNTTWDEQNEGYIHFQFPQFIVKYNDGDKIMIADNRFPSVTIANRNLKAEQIFAHYLNGVVTITIETSRLNGITSSSSVAEKRNAFNTWLTSNPIIIYYVMVTPTTTEITDETLLEQLEAIGELYRGTNNIMITDTIAPVENIIIEKSNAEFDLVPYIKREPKLDYIDRKGDTGYTADGHYFENIIARKRAVEFELIPMSQDNYLTVISNFIDKTQIPVYIDDLFTGETNLIQTYKKEKIPTKQITENGIVRGTTIKLEEI